MSNWGRDRDGRHRTTAELVVDVVRGQIERGQLRPGQRLPPERELAARLGVSRPSVRTGLRTLATLGIVRTRHGSGTYVTEGPPRLDARPLRMLSALHGFRAEHLDEARRLLEISVAGLAAERAGGEHLTVDGGAGVRDVCVGGGPAGVCHARCAFSPRDCHGGRESDPRLDRRDGDAAVLRAIAGADVTGTRRISARWPCCTAASTMRSGRGTRTAPVGRWRSTCAGLRSRRSPALPRRGRGLVRDVQFIEQAPGTARVTAPAARRGRRGVRPWGRRRAAHREGRKRPLEVGAVAVRAVRLLATAHERLERVRARPAGVLVNRHGIPSLGRPRSRRIGAPVRVHYIDAACGPTSSRCYTRSDVSTREDRAERRQPPPPQRRHHRARRPWQDHAGRRPAPAERHLPRRTSAWSSA